MHEHPVRHTCTFHTCTLYDTRVPFTRVPFTPVPCTKHVYPSHVYPAQCTRSSYTLDRVPSTSNRQSLTCTYTPTQHLSKLISFPAPFQTSPSAPSPFPRSLTIKLIICSLSIMPFTTEWIIGVAYRCFHRSVGIYRNNFYWK